MASNSSYFDQLGAQMGIDGRMTNSLIPGECAQIILLNQLHVPDDDCRQRFAATNRSYAEDGQVISDLGGSGAKPTMQLVIIPFHLMVKRSGCLRR